MQKTLGIDTVPSLDGPSDRSFARSTLTRHRLTDVAMSVGRCPPSASLLLLSFREWRRTPGRPRSLHEHRPERMVVASKALALTALIYSLPVARTAAELTSTATHGKTYRTFIPAGQKRHSDIATIETVSIAREFVRRQAADDSDSVWQSEK